MPTAQGNHATHDYAERIHERLPRRLQDLREVTWLSMYALWQKCGVSRDTISRIEGGETITGVHVLARLAWGVAETLEGFSAASRISKVVRTAPLCGLSGSNAMNRTEDCAGDVIMGLVREPSYFRGFPQALSRVHVHVFAEW
jgi:hypothetical protein